MGTGLLLAHLWSEGRGRGRLGLTRGVPVITVQGKYRQATLGVVAWGIGRLGEQGLLRGSRRMNRGEHSPRPTAGTINGATQIQTPSRAEHGPEGVMLFRKQPRRCLRNRSSEKLVS
jgi:hypothetical protein